MYGYTALAFDHTSLTFTSTDWNSPQQVTLFGVDDHPTFNHRYAELLLSVDENSDSRFVTAFTESLEVLVLNDDLIIVPAPPKPVLTTSFDTGVKGDSKTSNQTPEFSGSALPNHLVLVKVNGQTIGETRADDLGNWRFGVSDAMVVDYYVVTIAQENGLGNVSIDSEPLAIQILNSDVNAPQISVRGNDIPVSSGDLDPAVIDGTDFGVVEVSGNLGSTFTVFNDGLSNLHPSVTLSTGLALTEGLSSLIAPGDSDTFSVGMDTSRSGRIAGVVLSLIHI